MFEKLKLDDQFIVSLNLTVMSSNRFLSKQQTKFLVNFKDQTNASQRSHMVCLWDEGNRHRTAVYQRCLSMAWLQSIELNRSCFETPARPVLGLPCSSGTSRCFPNEFNRCLCLQYVCSKVGNKGWRVRWIWTDLDSPAFLWGLGCFFSL